MGGSGSKKSQSAQAPLCNFLPPHFAVAGLATQALLRNRKTSVTCYVMRNNKSIYIARDLKLDEPRFNDFVACSMSSSDYKAILEELD
jgi:hypothetical protein